MNKKTVSIIMGSDSDLKTMVPAANLLEKLGIDFELTVVSAHRTPKRLYSYAQTAKKRGIEVIIAAAGGAAHLPGMTASITLLPVIAVPIETKRLKGLDSLLSIAQMPAGIPVATMAVDNSQNAALMAARILALKYPRIEKNLFIFSKKMEREVLKKAKKLEKLSYKKYLKQKN